jgi:hypothetical protein
VSWPAKQERPAGGWPAKPPPMIKSVKCLYEEGRERERERERKRELERIIDPNTQFLYPCMLYVYFAPVNHKAQRRRLISSLTLFDWYNKY